MLKFKEQNDIKFPLIADRGNKISKNYNVFLTEKDPDHDRYQVDHAIPSKFLINKKGRISWQYIGTKKDRPTIEQIINAIDTNL